jgi:transcriptional regulator with PAS, ATPase and Fis domain
VAEGAAPLSRQLWSLVEQNGMTLGEAVSLCERILVGEALKIQKGNRTRAAKSLGIHVRTLFKKLSQSDSLECTEPEGTEDRSRN